MPKVIVNSTPLIVLSNVGKLDLLKRLYGEITIPEAVWNEVTQREDSACRVLKRGESWIHIERVKDLSQNRIFSSKLHEGEVEVILLAQSSSVSVLAIIDDNAAKKTAKFLKIPVTGTLGVLLRAKTEGHIDLVSPILEEMETHGFFISPKVKEYVLKAAGEEPDSE